MKTYFKYWGKAAKDKAGEKMRYHLLAYHSLDVAAVAVEFLKVSPLLKYYCDTLAIKEDRFLDIIGFLCVIHDIGKFAEGFQNLRPDLYKFFNNKKSSASYPEKHWSLGYRFLCENTQMMSDAQKISFLDALDRWLAASAGHHGRPPKNEMNAFPVNRRFSPDGMKDALEFMKDVKCLFGQCDFDFFIEKDENILRTLSWNLAGLIVLADWIGSNEAWFSYHQDIIPLGDYWQKYALPSARKAVRESRISPLPVARYKTTKHLFPVITIPTSLQSKVEEIKIPDGPKLFIIEDLTGSGKTETALALAHRIMTSGDADGIYFGLPTMATANAMYDRVEAVYKEFYASDTDPSLILAHSMSRQYLALEKDSDEQDYANDEECAGQDLKGWLFDNRKKAFLANVGVGTVDQALLGVLPVRHQALRLLGLYRKVLIVDEVHAYDSYTNKLLCNLLEFHAARGGHAILLSATLPHALREDFIKAFVNGMQYDFSGNVRDEYPLLTMVSGDIFLEMPVSSPEHLHKKVTVPAVHDIKEILTLIESALQKGKCVCWIRNTVQDATEAWALISEKLEEDKLTLFHARFALGDRLSIERSVVNNFGSKSSAQDRRGKLVVATQVAEQSLDLDFDFMVSDLAPIDLIIQRAGRLCRHRRDASGNRAEHEQRPLPEMAVFMPEVIENAKRDWYSALFPRAAKVYEHHGRLWLTAKWLTERKAFRMPDDARTMIEYVYGDESQAKIPDALQLQENRAGGNDRAQAGVAQYNGLKVRNGYMADMLSWPDDENAPTRIGEPATTVRLALWKDGELAPYFNNDWFLSQLTVYRSLIAAEDGQDQKAIAAVKVNMPDKGKYCVVVPLRETEGGFEGLARDGQSHKVKVYYDRARGLRVERQGDSDEFDL
ncbi:MAG: CRISPR-associated helicase Cas3' [Candidatus Omnitrophica bacterium]|nr:CRISPR-associated helicase Cas3' [Candidatus Omnitrophota bacterium]